VSTCSPVNVTVSRERLRCSETVTNRGQAGLANRTEVTMPSTTVPVSRTSAMSPVARVANQSGLVAVAKAALGITASAQEPPLVLVPAPEEDETPDEEDVPPEVPVDDDPADEDEPPTVRCGSRPQAHPPGDLPDPPQAIIPGQRRLGILGWCHGMRIAGEPLRRH
jgi:hypothetical protein